MFRLHDGKTTIARSADGRVEICTKIKVANMTYLSTIFTADEWVSAVTAVAKNADSAETHEAVKKIHGVE